jgi:hypothetical protein
VQVDVSRIESIAMSERGNRNAEFARLLRTGRELLDEDEAVRAHSAFEYWISSVGDTVAGYCMPPAKFHPIRARYAPNSTSAIIYPEPA